MKYYDNRDNFNNRIHTIRVTFQSGEYTGHIAYEMGGNCQGLDVMDFDPDCISPDDMDTYVENDCDFSCDEAGVFYLLLHNQEGNTLECEPEDSEMRDYVVAIEIVNCKVEGKVNEQDKN